MGFTMLEMLIVITIILVLAALLLTTMGGMRDRAHAVTCTGNLRNLGSLLIHFTTVYGGRQPGAAKSTGHISDPWGDGYMAWYDFIWEFAGEGNPRGQVPRDKSLPGHEIWTSIYRCPMTDYEQSWRSYAMSYASGPNVVTKGALQFGELLPVTRLRSRVRGGTIENEHPSDTAWLADSRPNGISFSSRHGFGLMVGSEYPPEFSRESLSVSEIHFRHGNRANVLFYDGHVGLVHPPDSLEALSRERWVRFFGD